MPKVLQKIAFVLRTLWFQFFLIASGIALGNTLGLVLLDKWEMNTMYAINYIIASVLFFLSAIGIRLDRNTKV